MIKLPPIITHAYLMVTEFCPLRCEYCYIKNRGIMNEFPYEWMNKIKNMFTCSSKPRLVFFGGEPLVKKDLIKKIVENYNNDFQFQVVTNGTVNFHEFMDEVYEPNRRKFDVQISWDGDIETRNNALGDKTYVNVYNDSILPELEKGRILVGRAVLNEQSVKCFFNTYKTFQMLNKKYMFGADFTIAHQPSFKESYHKDLREQLNLIYNDFSNDLNGNERLWFPPMLLKTILNIWNNGKVISCDVGNYVVIKPNGDIYPCTILSQIDERFKLGNINTTVDTEIIELLKYGSSCTKDCAFKSICDGGCRYERIKNFPNTWCKDICSHTCDIYKALYEETKQFLVSLNEYQFKRLKKLVDDYEVWEINYSTNSHDSIDNQSRMSE